MLKCPMRLQDGRIDFLELLGWLTARQTHSAEQDSSTNPLPPAWGAKPADETQILRITEVPIQHTMYMRSSGTSIVATDHFEGIPGIHFAKLPIVQPIEYGSRPRTADLVSKMPAVHADLLAQMQLEHDSRPRTAPEGIQRHRSRPNTPSVLDIIYSNDEDGGLLGLPKREQEVAFEPHGLALSEWWDKVDERDYERTDLVEMAMKRIYDKVGHNPKRAMQVFREIDEDQSGALDFDEFEQVRAPQLNSP